MASWVAPVAENGNNNARESVYGEHDTTRYTGTYHILYSLTITNKESLGKLSFVSNANALQVLRYFKFI